MTKPVPHAVAMSAWSHRSCSLLYLTKAASTESWGCSFPFATTATTFGGWIVQQSSNALLNMLCCQLMAVLCQCQKQQGAHSRNCRGYHAPYGQT